MARDSDIRRRVERVEEIVGRLDAGACSCSEAESLYEEGQETLREIHEILDGETGEVTEID